MVNINQYTKVKQKSTLKFTKNKFGNIIENSIVKTSIYRHRLVKTGGMRKVWVNKLNTALEQVINSNTDFKIISYILTHQSSKGFIKNNQSKPISINELSILFKISRIKISLLIKKLIEVNILKKHKRILYLNPYLILPYGNNTDDNYILQLMWTHNYEKTEDELKEEYKTFLVIDKEIEI